MNIIEISFYPVSQEYDDHVMGILFFKYSELRYKQIIELKGGYVSNEEYWDDNGSKWVSNTGKADGFENDVSISVEDLLNQHSMELRELESRIDSTQAKIDSDS